MIEDRPPAPPPSTGPPLPEHAVVTALRDGVAALDRVAAAPLWSLTDDQALAAMDKAYALMAQAQGLASRLLCEVDQRQLATRAGAPSTKAWLRRRHQLTPGRARRDVELARALDGPLQATAAALSAGALSSEQAAAIADVLSHAPRSAGSTEKGQAEALLIESSGRHDPHELRRLGIHIWAVLDPDGVDADEGRRLEAQEARAFARRRFAMPSDGDGGVFVSGHLDAEGGATVRTALDPLAAPLPATAEGPDRRTASQRYADALVELCRRALQSGELPDSGGEPPQLVLTVTADGLRDVPASAGGPAAGWAGGGVAQMDDGGLLSAQAARRIGCDAVLASAALDVAGVPLSLGRRRRLFTGALRRALVLRDRGCAFPGCDRPARWCQGHHIQHWADGGETSLENAVLLCGYHHRLIHRGEWRVSLGADGHPDFHPPPWVGRDPLRNTNHRDPGRVRWVTGRSPASAVGRSSTPGAGGWPTPSLGDSPTPDLGRSP